jgi:hypothetical protein
MYKQKLYAKGGVCTGVGCPGCASCMAEGGDVGMYAKGGNVDEKSVKGDEYSTLRGVHRPIAEKGESKADSGMSAAGLYNRGGSDYDKKMGKSLMRQVSGETKKMLKNKPKIPMAEGGDVVDRIMMSRGGKVANETEDLVDFAPNQFDDLVLRDDLEQSYTGANSGDHLGNMAEDERERDMIAKIMKSRALKGRMPRPA